MKRTLALSVISVCSVVNAAAACIVAIDLGNIEYRKLETRAPRAAMLDKMMNQTPIRWSPWMVLTPFPGNEKGFLARPLPPEDELPKMSAGGAGPDLQAKYIGKQNREITWRKLSDEPDRAMSLKIYREDEMNLRGTGYLYCTATVDRPVSLPVTMGSDDGLRFWLNGKLLIDADVPRGLNVEDHRLTLDLKAGVNHLLAKVTQGAGGWDYQLITRTARVDPVLDAKLQYQLNIDFPTDEDEYYRIATVPVPLDVVLEVGGLDTLPDGRIAVCTRRGEVYLVEYADEDPPFEARFKLFASGLHEPLGVAARVEEGQLAVYCVQRPELTRLVDTNGDGRADLYDTFCDAWGVSGNYHEFAFGPKFDAEGNAWVTLNVGFCDALGKSIAPYRGWAVKVTPDRQMIPVCDGRVAQRHRLQRAGRLLLCRQPGRLCRNQQTLLDVAGFVSRPPGRPALAQGLAAGRPRTQAHAARGVVPLQEDGPIRRGLRDGHDRRQVRPVRWSVVRGRSVFGNRDARRAREGQRARWRLLSGRVLPLPAGSRSRREPAYVRQQRRHDRR